MPDEINVENLYPVLLVSTDFHTIGKHTKKQLLELLNEFLEETIIDRDLKDFVKIVTRKPKLLTYKGKQLAFTIVSFINKQVNQILLKNEYTY